MSRALIFAAIRELIPCQAADDLAVIWNPRHAGLQLGKRRFWSRGVWA